MASGTKEAIVKNGGVQDVSPFRRLYQELQEQIVSGRQTGRLPSIAELSAHYGINHNTVKKAINQLKEQRFVYSVQGKGTFVNPDGGVNVLAQKNVTLFLHQTVLLNPFYSRLVYALRALLERERCAVAIVNTLSQLKSFAGQIDALLLFEQFNDAELNYLEQLLPRRRLIACNCRGPDDSHEVGTDYEAAGRLAARHLYERGCRRVGVLAIADDLPPEYADNSHFHRRRKGFMAFAAEHPDLAVDAVEIPPAEVFFDRRIDLGWSERLFDGGRAPDGLFLFMDKLAFGVYETMRRRGVRVPVLGFDDMEYATDLYPSLSSIREDVEGVAGEAVDLIRAILAGGPPPPRRRLVPARLIERESTLSAK